MDYGTMTGQGSRVPMMLADLGYAVVIIGIIIVTVLVASGLIII